MEEEGACVETVTVYDVARAKVLMRDVTTSKESPFPEATSDLPVYSLKSMVYPFTSTRTKNSSPHFVGLSLIYCLIPSLVFVATILSSTEIFCLRWHASGPRHFQQMPDPVERVIRHTAVFLFTFAVFSWIAYVNIGWDGKKLAPGHDIGKKREVEKLSLSSKSLKPLGGASQPCTVVVQGISASLLALAPIHISPRSADFCCIFVCVCTQHFEDISMKTMWKYFTCWRISKI